MTPPRKSVLIVEDDDKDFQKAAGRLEKLGLAVTRETRGDSALQTAAEGKPDLILMDVVLTKSKVPPDDWRFNGWEVCRRLKNHEDLEVRRIPVLMITGVREADKPGAGGAARSFAAGADDHLTKGRLKELEARALALMRRSLPAPYSAAAGERAVSISARAGFPMDITVGVVEFRSQTRMPLDLNAAALARRGRAAYQTKDWRFEAGEIGRELYRQVFGEHPELMKHFSEIRGEGGQIRLRFSGPRDALAVPLEFLFDPDDQGGTQFALRYPLARSIWGFRSPRTPLGAAMLNDLWRHDTPLEILLVGSNTEGELKHRGGLYHLPRIDGADAEIEALASALARSFEAKGIRTRIRTLPTARASYETVRQVLSRGRYHVVHYSGHAHYPENAPEECALFFWEKEGRHGRIKPMTAVELWTLFGGRRGPSFVYLSCCRGAETGAESFLLDNDFLGLADGLVKAEVPAVLGFRWPVSDCGAKALALAFYEALAETGNCDSALLSARQQLATDRNDRTWLSPVLVIQG